MAEVKITFLGDMLCEQQQIAAATCCKGGYDAIFSQVKHVWAESDLTIGNLETPVAGKKLRYSYERLRFNAPDEFALAIKDAGVGLVSLANNHILDRGVKGLNRTLETLSRIGLDSVGAYATQADSERIFVRNLKGVKIAFVACTYGVNQGLKCNRLKEDELWRVPILKHPPHQVASFAFHVRRFLSNLVPVEIKDVLRARSKRRITSFQCADSVDVSEYGKKEHNIYLERVLSSIEHAKNMADLVVALPHMGGQFCEEPGPWQRKITEDILAAGADIVVENHAHYPLPLERRGNRLIAYGLGDFCAMPTSIKLPWANHSLVLTCYIDPETKRLTNQAVNVVKIVRSGERGVSVVSSTKTWKVETNEVD